MRSLPPESVRGSDLWMQLVACEFFRPFRQKPGCWLPPIAPISPLFLPPPPLLSFSALYPAPFGVGGLENGSHLPNGWRARSLSLHNTTFTRLIYILGDGCDHLTMLFPDG